MKTMKIKINTELKGFQPGRVINLELDNEGLAKDPFWRRRIKDSLIDNCVEIVKDRPQVKRTKKHEEEKKIDNK